MGLAIAWTRNLPEDQKEQFEKAVRNSSTVLSRLEQILIEDEQMLLKSVPNFDEASWAYHQAFNLGELARLRKLKELFSFLHKG